MTARYSDPLILLRCSTEGCTVTSQPFTLCQSLLAMLRSYFFSIFCHQERLRISNTVQSWFLLFNIPSIFVLSPAFNNKQQEETRQPLQHFTWKFPYYITSSHSHVPLPIMLQQQFWKLSALNITRLFLPRSSKMLLVPF